MLTLRTRVSLEGIGEVARGGKKGEWSTIMKERRERKKQETGKEEARGGGETVEVWWRETKGVNRKSRCN